MTVERKHGPGIRLRLGALALFAATVLGPGTGLGQTIVTNWVAFDDHVPDVGTAANVTPYNIWTGPGGYLTNFSASADHYKAGQELLVKLDVSYAGSVGNQATVVLPDPGTPADLLFTGIVDMNAPSFIFTLNQFGQTIMKFTGLDPAMYYKFQTTGARGRQDDIADRWTMCSLEGAASFTEAFTSLGGTNAISKRTFPASNLKTNQIAWNSGRNADAGDVIGWDKIVPGADGSITIVTEQYTGPNPGGYAAGAYGYGLVGFQLIEYGPRGAVSFAEEPPAVVQVEQMRPLTLSVRVVGSSPKLQWYKQGGPIGGATHPVLNYTNAAVADSGDYYAVISSTLGSMTSSVAHVTVSPDVTAPTVASVTSSGQVALLNLLHLQFSEYVQGAEDLANYSLAGFNVTAASYKAAQTNVVLTLDKPLVPGQSYSITVKNVKDMAGNTMTTATIPFQCYSVTSGFLTYDYWGGLDTANNDITQTLMTDPRYPNAPDWSAFVTAFDSRTIFPDDSHEGYGSRISGYFVPPADGNWTFFLRSDDSSRLYFNSNGPDPAGKALIAEETGCCQAFLEPDPNQGAAWHDNGNGMGQTTLTPIALKAGQRYYIEAIHKEGTGGDYLQVTGRLQGDTTPAANLLPLPGSMFMTLADSVGSSITITQQPASVTIVQRPAQGTPATLRNDTFSANDGGYKVDGTPAPDKPWTWDAGSHAWSTASPGGSGPYATHLTTPTITLAGAGTVSVTFNHRYSMEEATGATAFDGGVVELSVNGGDFTPVPATNFVNNGYVAVLTGVHELINLAGFAHQSANYDTPNYISSTAYLGTFNVGDTLAIRFAAAWDANTMGTDPNWEINSVKVEVGAVAPLNWATFSVGAKATYQNNPSTAVSYTWQRDDGSGFKDITAGDFISPLNQPTYLVKVGLQDNGAKFRCRMQGLTSSATSDAATLTVTTNLVTRPSLSVSMAGGGNVKIAWPVSASGFKLQRASTLSAAASAWTVVPESTYQTDATSTYVLVAPTGTAFYRVSQ